MDYPRYTSEQTAKAIGVTMSALAGWLHRGSAYAFRDEDEAAPTGMGRTRLFKYASVQRLAVYSRLVRIGLVSKLANDCAMTFVDFGEQQHHPGPPDLGDRLPGNVYAGNVTLLRIDFPAVGEPVAKIGREELTIDTGRNGAVLIVDLGRLIADLNVSLGRV